MGWGEAAEAYATDWASRRGNSSEETHQTKASKSGHRLLIARCANLCASSWSRACNRMRRDLSRNAEPSLSDQSVTKKVRSRGDVRVGAAACANWTDMDRTPWVRENDSRVAKSAILGTRFRAQEFSRASQYRA